MFSLTGCGGCTTVTCCVVVVDFKKLIISSFTLSNSFKLFISSSLSFNSFSRSLIFTRLDESSCSSGSVMLEMILLLDDVTLILLILFKCFLEVK